MSKLFFFRHAQASFLADNYDELSAHGEKQSEELGKYLVKNGFHFDKIFVGPLSRQKKTFEIVADVFSKNKLEIPAPIFIKGLREHSGTEAMHFAFPRLKESVPYVKELLEAIELNPSLKKRNMLLAFQFFMEKWSEDKIDVPEVEAWKVFRENARKGLFKILEKTGKGEIIGAFTSGGTISSITGDSLGIKDETKIVAMNFSVRNTSFTSFLYSKNKFNLLSFNELPHLEEDMVTFI